ncbi:MAG: putative dehydrogenase [Candidatus Latescibacterota bacterium]|jgi:predicted dehydrogenase
MFKCAIIGVSGGRARGLAEGYQHIKKGMLAAISTRNEENLNAFGEEFGVDSRYADYREMFAKEKPDLVHVNTPPNVRLEIFEAAEEADVPAVLVEKPLAIQGEDWRAIKGFAATSKTKIAINHQLHFHPRRQQLQNIVREGKIGEIRFIEASCGLNLAYQGTHALQAIGAFHPEGVPARVMGQVSGTDGLVDTPKKHFAPDQCTAAIAFADGVRAQLVAGPFAPRVKDDERAHIHKRIAVYGTRGYVQWTMWSWEVGIDGQIERGVHAYPDEDILGQAAMTDALLQWVEDDKKMHPLNLNTALRDFNIILGIYTSALERRPVDLPCEPAEDLMAALQNALSS